MRAVFMGTPNKFEGVGERPLFNIETTAGMFNLRSFSDADSGSHFSIAGIDADARRNSPSQEAEHVAVSSQSARQNANNIASFGKNKLQSGGDQAVTKLILAK